MNRLAELLAAVYAAPDDLQTRLVYADALSEAGNPRGEFIALQCAGGSPLREQELVAEHWPTWVGTLANILDPTATTARSFTRGFLRSARIKKGPRPAIAKTIGDPIWSTVEELRFHDGVGGVVVKSGQVVRGNKVPAAALVLHPVMRSLHQVTGIDGDVLMTLCREGDALPVQSITSSTYGLLLERDENHSWKFIAEAEELLARARGLPGLRKLELHGYPSAKPDVRWLLRSPLSGRLEQLKLENFGGPVDHWIEQAQAAHPNLRELVVDYWGFMRFTRGSGGALNRMSIGRRNLSHHQRNTIDEALARVPPGTVEVVPFVA